MFVSEEIDTVQKTADEQSSDDIVVLIPAFNESLVIGSVVLQARKYASRVIVVDDGSADNTSEVAGLAGAEVITMPQNVGKASAMMAGFARARELNAKATVMMDGDGQHFASDIPVVAAPVLSGEADMVVGSRFLETGTGEEEIPAYRRIGQKVLNEATNLSSDVKCSDSQSGFRPPGSSVHGILLLQGIFLTRGSNPRLLRWQVGSLPLALPISGHYFPQRKEQLLQK